MKSILRSLTAVLLLAVIFSSCKKSTPSEAKYIPKDADAVFVLDLKQMQDKLQKGGISTDSLVARLFRNEPADSKERAEFNELRNNAGINWNEKLFVFFQTKKHSDKSTSMVFSAIGHLDDAAKLEAYLKKQEHTKDSAIHKEADYSYQVMNGGGMLAWNDKHVIVTHYTHTPQMTYDSVSMSFGKSSDFNQLAEMKAQVNGYFTQKESVADQPAFAGMFKEKADGYMYSSSASSLSYLSMLPIQAPRLQELLSDNFSTATLNFEDGKIVAKSTYYTNPMLTNLIKKYSGPTVNLSMLEKYPSANINGFMLFAFNPEMFGSLLKELELESMANLGLQRIGLTAQDIYKSFKGDISVVVSDLGMTGIEPQMKKDEKNMISKKPWGKMIIHAPVGDKASFAKVMDKAVEAGVMVKTASGYKGSALVSLIGMYVEADANNLVIASDSLTYQQYMSGTAKSNINQEVLNGFKGKTGAFYFDIANTLAAFSKDSAATAGYNRSVATARETFKDFIGSSDQFDGKTVKGTFEVRMQDGKQNSLVTLTRLFTDIAIDMRQIAKTETDAYKLFPGDVPAIIRTN